MTGMAVEGGARKVTVWRLAAMRCYRLVPVPLPSVLIGASTPQGVLLVMGCCTLRYSGNCVILRFRVFGLVKTE